MSTPVEGTIRPGRDHTVTDVTVPLSIHLPVWLSGLAEAVHHEPLPTPEALKIYVNQLRDHIVFAFEVRSWRWLRQQFPGVRIAPRVSIGRDTKSDVELQIKDVHEQIVILLAGVSLQRLAEAGVQAIDFIDVESEELVDRMAITGLTSALS